jgi:hypothetical protein
MLKQSPAACFYTTKSRKPDSALTERGTPENEKLGQIPLPGAAT